MKLVVKAKDFKKLATAVTKFPSIGNFAGSEMVNLRASNGRLVATAFGIVLSKITVPAVGELPLVAIDERQLRDFASIVNDNGKVSIQISKKVLFMRYGSRAVKVNLQEGQINQLPELPKDRAIKLNKSTASKLAYLSDIAFSDQSRPEIAAVMLQDGKAMACDQKAISVLTCDKDIERRTAIPVTLSKVLTAGSTIFPGKTETTIKIAGAYYSMPAPVEAQKHFPAKKIQRYGAVSKDLVFITTGRALFHAISDCDTCIGQVSRLEVVISLSGTYDTSEISIRAENAGAQFRAKIKGKVAKKEITLVVPLARIVSAMPFVEHEKFVKFYVGKHGETFLEFSFGWVMFPSWSK